MSPIADSLNKNETTIRISTDGFSYVIDNERHTFVPSALFQESKKDKYLDFLGLTDNNSIVLTDFISEIDAYNVYSISKKDFAALKKPTENADYQHISTVLTEKLVKESSERTDIARVYLYVRNQSFEMTVLNGAKLLFNNNFRFKTKEDFLYFLLFSMEQLQLDAESTPVYFLGMIEEDSNVVELCSRYVRDIRFKKDITLYKSIECES